MDPARPPPATNRQVNGCVQNFGHPQVCPDAGVGYARVVDLLDADRVWLRQVPRATARMLAARATNDWQTWSGPCRQRRLPRLHQPGPLQPRRLEDRSSDPHMYRNDGDLELPCACGRAVRSSRVRLQQTGSTASGRHDRATAASQRRWSSRANATAGWKPYAGHAAADYAAPQIHQDRTCPD